MGTEFNRSVQPTLRLLDSLVKPIPLYGSDFWGELKPPTDDPKYHHMVYKHVLRVQKEITIGVLLELGRITLHIHSKH